MESSLKTFLAGKNGWLDGSNNLKKAIALRVAILDDDTEDSAYVVDENPWFCDVLEDGTAITYSVPFYP